MVRALTDEEIDAAYPIEVRSNARFWTPAPVAARAATLFRAHGATRVVDVGSGVGKMCIVAASAAQELEVVGFEQRPALIAIARDASRALGCPNVRFVEGDATAIEWDRFDGIYLFNPFGENTFVESQRFDESVELGPARFDRDVARVERALDEARIGTVVVTYLRFGGRISEAYDLEAEERIEGSFLRAWVKRRGPSLERGWWLEWDSGAVRVARSPNDDD